MNKTILAEYLFGYRTSHLIKYFLLHPRKSIYQGRVAQDLEWNLSTTQYHLEWFVKLGILDRSKDNYRTYYQLDKNSIIIKFFKKFFQPKAGHPWDER
jgi:hypothetical protein